MAEGLIDGVVGSWTFLEEQLEKEPGSLVIRDDASLAPRDDSFLVVQPINARVVHHGPGDDLKLVREAHIRSNERMWEQLVRPLCQQLISNPTLVDRLGLNTCLHAIMESMPVADVSQSVRHVAEIRAGLRPLPGPNDSVNPVEKMLLGFTGETRVFESDLARSLGPDEAHRITYYDDKCMGTMGF